MVKAMLACAVVTTGSGGAVELADLPRIPEANLVAFSMLLTERVTNPAELDESVLRRQAVAQKEFSFDVMIPRWEAPIARVRTPYAYACGESQ